MPDLDEKYNEFSRELNQSVSPETEPTEENVCDERSYDERLKDIFSGENRAQRPDKKDQGRRKCSCVCPGIFAGTVLQQR